MRRRASPFLFLLAAKRRGRGGAGPPGLHPLRNSRDLRPGSARRELDGTRLALVRRLAKNAELEGGQIAVGLAPAPEAPRARRGHRRGRPEEVMEAISRRGQLSALRHIAELASNGTLPSFSPSFELEMHLEDCLGACPSS
eukprot:tig00020800_g13728.t1